MQDTKTDLKDFIDIKNNDGYKINSNGDVWIGYRLAKKSFQVKINKNVYKVKNLVAEYFLEKPKDYDEVKYIV